jgi:hypothetical protein
MGTALALNQKRRTGTALAFNQKRRTGTALALNQKRRTGTALQQIKNGERGQRYNKSKSRSANYLQNPPAVWYDQTK